VHCHDELTICQIPIFVAVYGASSHGEVSTILNRNVR
jgi:hypothetical protein